MILRFFNWYIHSKTRIRISNFINRQISNLINNKFSNWIKEVFDIGMNYPVYMFNDETKVYVSKITDGRLDDGRRYSDVTTVDRINLAKNFRSYNYFYRKHLLNKVNKIINGELVFRFKGVATVKSKIQTGETDILPPLRPLT